MRTTIRLSMAVWLVLLGRARAPVEESKAPGRDPFELAYSIPAAVDRPAYRACAISPDGKWLATAKVDEWNVAEIRETFTGKVVQTLVCTGVISFMGFSSDGEVLAVSQLIPGTDFWRTSEWSKSATIEHRETFVRYGAALSHDGRFFAGVSAFLPGQKFGDTPKGSLKVWEIGTDEPVRRESFRRGSRAPFVAFPKEFSRLNPPLALTDKMLLSKTKNPGFGAPAALTPDGKLLAVNSRFGKFAVVSSTSGKVIHQFPSLGTGIGYPRIIKDGKQMLVSGGERGNLTLFEWPNRRLATLDPPAGQSFGPLEASDDGRWVVVATSGDAKAEWRVLRVARD